MVKKTDVHIDKDEKGTFTTAKAKRGTIIYKE